MVYSVFQVWPAAPRESLFVSHIRRVEEMKRPHAHDLYIVCNKDIKRDDIPVRVLPLYPFILLLQLGSSSSVRVGLTVSMICETVLLNKKPLDQLTRADVRCDIIYVSQGRDYGILLEDGVFQFIRVAGCRRLLSVTCIRRSIRSSFEPSPTTWSRISPARTWPFESLFFFEYTKL